MALEEMNPNPFYSFTYTSHAGGFMQEVMLALYKKANEDHGAWIEARSKLKEGNPQTNHLRRMSTDYKVEENASPFLIKIQDCIRIVEDIEAEKKGTQDEKNLSTFDKYKLAVKYM